MTRITQILVLIAFVAIGQTALCQSPYEVFERTWKGESKIESEISPGGVGYLSQYMYDVTYYGDQNKFSAKLETSVLIDGSYYYSTSWVDGYVNIETYAVTIYMGKEISSDQLPYGLYWSPETLYLTVYKDEDHSGHYILNGKSSGMSKSYEYFELATYY